VIEPPTTTITPDPAASVAALADLGFGEYREARSKWRAATS
jgi:hypothetical protein